MFARYSEALALVGILKCLNADFSSTGKSLLHIQVPTPIFTVCLEFGGPRIYRRHAKTIVRLPVPKLTFDGLTCFVAVHQILRLLLERPKDVPGLSEEVWILLTRHRIDTHRPFEFISLRAEYDDGHPDTPKSFADTSRTQGVYTDNVHVLVRTTTQGTLPQN